MLMERSRSKHRILLMIGNFVIGHFTTIFRPVVFLMAGMSGMSLTRFAFWNGLGCVAWAYLIPKLGQFGGDILGWLWSLF